MKKEISVVVVDLDNTLFDWVAIWYASFDAMLSALTLESGIPRETLIADFKAVHERHGTSEYAFAIEELQTLTKRFPGENLPARFAAAIEAYRSARRSAMRLYPDVEESLQTLKDKGCLIIGYTESMAFYTHYRMRQLGLDRLLDVVYSPEDHDLPQGLTPDQIRLYPKTRYELRRTKVRHTPKGEFKPNAKVLLQILSDFCVRPSEALYVGDSMMKDIAMANAAQVSCAWAKYGAAHQREEYELLRAVTHWTKQDVERERNSDALKVFADATLETSFAQIFDYFFFTPYVDRSPEKMSSIQFAWEKSVDVQMHFNEIGMKVRNFAITLLGVFLGGAAFAIKEHVILFGWMPLTFLILLFGLIVWFGFFVMDRYWYHKLLVGAVNHAVAIEKMYAATHPELGLSIAIGKNSPSTIGSVKFRSSDKLKWFYVIGLLIFVLGMAGSFFIATSPQSSASGKAQQIELIITPNPAASVEVKPTTASPSLP